MPNGTNGGRVSNADLFSSVNSMRLELKQDIAAAVSTVAQSQGRLERKFDELEAGRLTRAEGNIQELRVQMLKSTDSIRTNQAVLSTKILIIWGICSALLSIVGGIVVTRAIKL